LKKPPRAVFSFLTAYIFKKVLDKSSGIVCLID
jgi:hypothetical protein